MDHGNHARNGMNQWNAGLPAARDQVHVRFVEMRSAGDAQTAIAKLNGAELRGWKLTVDEAREKSARDGDRPRGSPGRR